MAIPGKIGGWKSRYQIFDLEENAKRMKLYLSREKTQECVQGIEERRLGGLILASICKFYVMMNKLGLFLSIVFCAFV
jgi:hypothetical protein